MTIAISAQNQRTWDGSGLWDSWGHDENESPCTWSNSASEGPSSLKSWWHIRHTAIAVATLLFGTRHMVI